MSLPLDYFLYNFPSLTFPLFLVVSRYHLHLSNGLPFDSRIVINFPEPLSTEFLIRVSGLKHLSAFIESAASHTFEGL